MTHVDVATISRAALSSPSSIFKRPLASLTFAANYLAGGMDPFGWKLVNLVIHLLNGLLVYLVTRALLELTRAPPADILRTWASHHDHNARRHRGGLHGRRVAAPAHQSHRRPLCRAAHGEPG